MAEEPKEVKVVINLKGNRATIGVQAPECDPVFACVEGTMGEIFKAIGKLLVDAVVKWNTSPRYPKLDLPQPAPAPTPATASRGARPTPTPQSNRLF